MKITQEKPEFKPITIVIETDDEAESLWSAIRQARPATPEASVFYNKISDWFSTEGDL